MSGSEAAAGTPPASLPGLEDIRAAARRLEPLAVRTPLLDVPGASARLGLRLLIKAEVLQRTGTFKFRGAYNRIAALSPEARKGGVVAFSSGNHAQGVAAAAALLGVPATIVMPADAPAIKLANTRNYGAEVVLYDRERDDREAIGRAIAGERGATLVPPFDDPWIIAGQGTVGLEIAEQCAELGLVPDAVLAPASGGGLIAGMAIALADACPTARLIACEPAGFDDIGRSLQAGKRESNAPGGRSICDALMAATPGLLPFALLTKLKAAAIAVTEAEVEQAMVMAFLELKLVVEPGGAAALAAVLAGKAGAGLGAGSGASPDGRPRVVVAVASGGNVDPALFALVLSRSAMK